MFLKSTFSQLKFPNRGFSLPELMVSVSIIIIITGVLLFRYTSFNGTTLLNSQAYEIALDVRQAQVSGVSVRGDSLSDFFEEYGVHFDAPDNEYIFFRDNNGNAGQFPARYHSSPNDEAIEVFRLDTRFNVLRICTDTSNPDCSGGSSVSDLDVTFGRPNFDARFYSSGDSSISTALIVLAPVGQTSPTREVFISSTGQISVQNN